MYIGLNGFVAECCNGRVDNCDRKRVRNALAKIPQQEREVFEKVWWVHKAMREWNNQLFADMLIHAAEK